MSICSWVGVLLRQSRAVQHIDMGQVDENDVLRRVGRQFGRKRADKVENSFFELQRGNLCILRV